MTILGVLVVLAVIWTFLFVYSKSDKETFPTLAKFKDSFFIIAHRGGSLEAPENTMAAFKASSAKNPNVLFELDVHYTKDKKIIVFHDETLDRTTNGKGFVKDFTYQELQELDAAYNFQNEQGEYIYRKTGVKIPLLEEVFEAFPNQRIIVEIKPSNLELTEDVFKLIQKYNRSDSTVLGSKHTRNVVYYRSLAPNVLTSVAPDEMLRTLMLANMYLEGLDKMRPAIYAIPEKSDKIIVLNNRVLAEVQRRNKKIFIWTINEEADMWRLIELGVNGLITDRPNFLFELLSKK